VKKALFQIADLRAPGLDGLHVVFYKSYWPILSILGEDITKQVLHAINTKVIPDG
jgi:hypothetical protein